MRLAAAGGGRGWGTGGGWGQSRSGCSSARHRGVGVDGWWAQGADHDEGGRVQAVLTQPTDGPTGRGRAAGRAAWARQATASVECGGEDELVAAGDDGRAMADGDGGRWGGRGGGGGGGGVAAGVVGWTRAGPSMGLAAGLCGRRTLVVN